MVLLLQHASLAVPPKNPSFMGKSLWAYLSESQCQSNPPRIPPHALRLLWEPNVESSVDEAQCIRIPVAASLSPVSGRRDAHARVIASHITQSCLSSLSCTKMPAQQTGVTCPCTVITRWHKRHQLLLHCHQWARGLHQLLPPKKVRRAGSVAVEPSGKLPHTVEATHATSCAAKALREGITKKVHSTVALHPHSIHHKLWSKCCLQCGVVKVGDTVWQELVRVLRQSHVRRRGARGVGKAVFGHLLVNVTAREQALQSWYVAVVEAGVKAVVEHSMVEGGIWRHTAAWAWSVCVRGSRQQCALPADDRRWSACRATGRTLGRVHHWIPTPQAGRGALH
jgi:hypothetical protein